MAETNEAVAFELVKFIFPLNGGDSTPEAILKLYAECLGVVGGESLELVQFRLKKEQEALPAHREETTLSGARPQIEH